MVIHAEIHDEVTVTRIPRHIVRKDLAIIEEGFFCPNYIQEAEGKSYN